MCASAEEVGGGRGWLRVFLFSFLGVMAFVGSLSVVGGRGRVGRLSVGGRRDGVGVSFRLRREVVCSRLVAPMEVITSGPVFKRSGLLNDVNTIDWKKWDMYAADLEEALGAEATVERIHLYYLPIFYWLKKQIRARTPDDKSAIVVGLSCPQGREM